MNNERRKRNVDSQFYLSVPLLIIVTIFIVSFSYEESWSYSWEGIRENVKDSIGLYEKQSITSGIGGNGENYSFEVKRRQWIMNYATIDEFKKLTKYPDGTIKAIAYQGLLRKEFYPQKKELILQIFKEEKSWVAYQSGCFGYTLKLKDYFMTYVLKLNLKHPPFRESFDFGLTEKEKKEITLEYEKNIDN